MVHDTIDIERWKAMFPLQTLREEARDFVLSRKAADPSRYSDQSAVDKHIALMSPDAGAITSPHDIAVVEQLRDEARAEGRFNEAHSAPVDVFVFSKGESAKREVTKIGGLPYWPRKKKWPHTGNWPFSGRPLSFIGQICFADSMDICGKLPGDILLVFGDVEDALSDEENALAFFWQNLGLTDLIAPGDVPDATRQLTPCYGSIHRTLDYDGSLDEDGFVKVSRDDYRLAVIEGTKIGGLPHWVQYSEDLNGRYVATIGSIQPTSERPFPWLNVSEPIMSFADAHDENMLMWGDMGSLYLSIDNKNGMHWLAQCG